MQTDLSPNAIEFLNEALEPRPAIRGNHFEQGKISQHAFFKQCRDGKVGCGWLASVGACQLSLTDVFEIQHTAPKYTPLYSKRDSSFPVVGLCERETGTLVLKGSGAKLERHRLCPSASLPPPPPGQHVHGPSP